MDCVASGLEGLKARVGDKWESHVTQMSKDGGPVRVDAISGRHCGFPAARMPVSSDVSKDPVQPQVWNNGLCNKSSICGRLC